MLLFIFVMDRLYGKEEYDASSDHRKGVFKHMAKAEKWDKDE
jgi:hypothetical protein